jgi:hypothetical protein
MGDQKFRTFSAKGLLISAQNFQAGSSSSGEASHRILSNNLLCFSEMAGPTAPSFLL